MGITARLRGYVRDSATMAPGHEHGLPPLRSALRRMQSVAVFALLDVNDAVIARTQPEAPEIWPTDRWPWIADIEAATDEIRAEITAYVSRGTIPHVAAVSGLDPDSEEGKASIPGLKGAWRTVLLFANGGWIEDAAAHFPKTRSVFEHVHPKANVGFSALEPRSHIETHVGPNRGALRFQLPIIIPGELGDCRIRVGDETWNWVEGEAFVFDLSVNHEAWNDTDEIRVLLMFEMAMPLPAPASWFNRLTQYSYRWHPSYRGMPDRIAGFARQHDAAAGTAA